MKTKKFSKKLALKKRTIAHLNRNEMKNVYGADTTCKCPTWTFTCGSDPVATCCNIT
jgi:hypothetical protein